MQFEFAPRSPMLEPREVIQTQLEIWGSENNTHLSLPYLGWVGICGSPEKQAISCGYAGRRGSETAWAGPPCSTLLLQGTPCTFGVNRLQTIALETREDVRNSSQMLRKLTEMAGREREELHHERAFALEHHRSSRQGVWAASPRVSAAGDIVRPRAVVLHRTRTERGHGRQPSTAKRDKATRTEGNTEDTPRLL